MLRRLYNPLCLAILALSLTDCTTLGPDYQEPDIAWLQDWEPTAYDTATNQPAQQETDLRFGGSSTMILPLTNSWISLIKKLYSCA